MASFKVGDKARFVRFAVDAMNNDSRLIGAEVVVVRIGSPGRGWDYTIRAPFETGVSSLMPPNCFGCMGSEIEPLTDPRAETFIADMARFAALSKKRCYPDVSKLTAEQLAAITGGA